MNNADIDVFVSKESVELQVKKLKKELSSGTSALVLLNILNNAEEPLYGYQIAKSLEHVSSEKQGAIYPVLRNMAAKGLLESNMLPSESGPPRKYFNISPLGQAVLKEWIAIWEQTQSFVNQSISNKPSGAKNVK